MSESEYKVEQGILVIPGDETAIALSQIEMVFLESEMSSTIRTKSGHEIEVYLTYDKLLKVWIDHSHWR